MRAFTTAFCANVKAMAPFHGVVIAYTAAVLLVAASQGALVAASYQQYLANFGPLYFIGLPLVTTITHVLLWCLRSDRPGLRTMVSALPTLSGNIASAVVTLAMLILFMGSFTTFKTLMPVLMDGFPHDRAQADIDAWLHGGMDPGPALLQALDYPFLLNILQWNYMVGWMVLAFIPAFFIATRKDASAIRLRYFLTFVSVWVVLVSLLACLFLSAGPVFYADVTGDAARFGGQMQVLLERIGPTHRPYLWQSYVNGTIGIGTGISAFPSVHVGVAAMNAFLLWDINRKAGTIGFIYLGIVALSSVLFGWHYAIDGYVSIVVVGLLHVGLKRLFANRPPMPAAAVVTSPNPATP
jgi:hypothetical protein